MDARCADGSQLPVSVWLRRFHAPSDVASGTAEERELPERCWVFLEPVQRVLADMHVDREVTYWLYYASFCLNYLVKIGNYFNKNRVILIKIG